MEEHKKAGRKSRAEIQAEMTSSPEFKAAVAGAVAEALASIAPELEAARTQAVSGRDSGDWADKLAMSISELTSQGTGRVRVSPEEMQRRSEARKKMISLIIEAKAERKVATYQIKNKIFLNQRIIEPFYMNRERRMCPTEIDFLGIPNDVMVPVNETAKAIFAAYRDSVGVVRGARGVTNPLPGEDEIGMTHGGLVVRNKAVTNTQRAHGAAVSEHPVEGPMPAYEEDGHDLQPLVIKSDKDKMQYTEQHILGTIAAPARVNA
jgi:hypothetical protein